MRILETDNRGTGVVNVERSNRRFDVGRLKRTLYIANRPHLERADDGAPSDFVMENVRLVAADDLVPSLSVRDDPDQIALRSGRDKERRLFSEALGGELF